MNYIQSKKFNFCAVLFIVESAKLQIVKFLCLLGGPLPEFDVTLQSVCRTSVNDVTLLDTSFPFTFIHFKAYFPDRPNQCRPHYYIYLNNNNNNNINCNWVVTRWQWLFYTYTNMKKKLLICLRRKLLNKSYRYGRECTFRSNVPQIYRNTDDAESQIILPSSGSTHVRKHGFLFSHTRQQTGVMHK